jgi:hypothetical protein
MALEELEAGSQKSGKKQHRFLATESNFPNAMGSALPVGGITKLAVGGFFEGKIFPPIGRFPWLLVCDNLSFTLIFSWRLYVQDRDN